MNLFSYVQGNPLNRIDRLGLWFDDMYQTYQGTIPVSVWALLPNVPQPVSDFVAGFGDTISGGLTSWIRGLWNEAYGLPDVVNKCSGSYKGGIAAGYAWEAAAIATMVWKAAALPLEKFPVYVFTQSRPFWHLGLETLGRQSLIHIGLGPWGYHLALGYVGPMAAYLHFYIDPWYPFFIRPWTR
jgi:hypothetical protein